MANDAAKSMGRGERRKGKGARCKLSAIWVQVHRAESGRRTVGQKQHTLNVKVLCKLRGGSYLVLFILLLAVIGLVFGNDIYCNILLNIYYEARHSQFKSNQCENNF